MKIIYIVLLIIGLISLLSAYCFTMYNKLVLMRNDINQAWEQVLLEIKNRFALAHNILGVFNGNNVDMIELENILTAYKSCVGVEKTISACLSLNKVLTSIINSNEFQSNINGSLQNWYNMIQENSQKLEKNRIIYNDYILKLNSRIELFPNNFIARLFHFYKWPFFSE